MNYIETMEALKGIAGWEVVTSFSVGGFEWLSFSRKNPPKLLIISAQKTTLVDCDAGEIEDCVAEWDEYALLAYCDKLPDEELEIAGQYGGRLNNTSGQSESVNVEISSNNMVRVLFISGGGQTLIFEKYGFYTCGFSYNGNYFVLADDGGITILRRTQAKV